MFKKIFIKAGLSPTQAEILDYLYRNKEDRASEIARKIKKSRAIVYRDLDEMVDLKLIEKIDEPNKVTVFKIEHPSNIEKFFDKKEDQVHKDRALFKNYLPDMVSTYNLINNKPGVRYYEGKEGIEIVAKDSLTAKGEIYSYIDTETVLKEISDFANFYIEERLKKKITKKIIEPDKKFIRQYLLKNNEANFDEKALTQTKLLARNVFSMNTIIQIYNNKISYINFSGKNIISIIIEDPHISDFHKKIFEFNWEKAKTLEEVEKGQFN
jgi:DNA-binding transcriptional ArsR family regulator